MIAIFPLLKIYVSEVVVNLTSAAQTYTAYPMNVTVESILDFANNGKRTWKVSFPDRTRAVKADEKTIRINVEDRTFKVNK